MEDSETKTAALEKVNELEDELGHVRGYIPISVTAESDLQKACSIFLIIHFPKSLFVIFGLKVACYDQVVQIPLISLLIVCYFSFKGSRTNGGSRAGSNSEVRDAGVRVGCSAG